MHDLTTLAALAVVVVGPAALAAKITANYYQNRYGAIAAALERLLNAADDEDAHDLDAALAHADDVLERRPA